MALGLRAIPFSYNVDCLLSFRQKSHTLSESTIPDGRTDGRTDGEAGNRTSYSPVGAGTGAELGNKANLSAAKLKLYTHQNKIE